MLNPELSNYLFLKTLKYRKLKDNFITSSRLKTNISGLNLRNPVGLAAGLDKNGIAISELSKIGFGFLEIGTVTHLENKGSKKPRVFRYPKEEAILNKLGFPNKGIASVYQNLSKSYIPIGLNIGGNKITQIISMVPYAKAYADYITINISCPNHENISSKNLKELLRLFKPLVKNTPLFIKVSPNLTEREIVETCDIALETKIDGIICTNTDKGWSGKPLMDKSTKTLTWFYKHLQGKIPLIGVGGISSAEDAYDKIKAGANAVQLYTAMTYKGISLIPEINRNLDNLLQSEGFNSVSEAVGKGQSCY